MRDRYLQPEELKYVSRFDENGRLYIIEVPFDLGGCPNVEEMPEFYGEMKKITCLKDLSVNSNKLVSSLA